MGIMDQFLRVIVRRDQGEPEAYQIPLGALLRSTAYDTGSPKARLVVLGEEGTPLSEDVAELEEEASEERLEAVGWLSDIVSSQSEIMASLWVEDMMGALSLTDEDVNHGYLVETISGIIHHSSMSVLSVLHDVGVIEASQSRRT